MLRLAADVPRFALLAEPLSLAALLDRLDDDRPPELDEDVRAGAAPNASPDITFWASSATASAISEPSLVALLTTELVALLAVSAASSPASRILRRAVGLALIAAAAAARPAASISLLIAALAILSNVSFMLPPSMELERSSEPSCRRLPPASAFVLFWLVKEALPPWLFDLPELFPLATFVSPSVACGKDGSAAKRFRWHRTEVKGDRRTWRRPHRTWSAAGGFQPGRPQHGD